MPRQQFTISAGDLERYGLKWTAGDKFRYRTYAALLILDKDAAKLYFRTTW